MSPHPFYSETWSVYNALRNTVKAVNLTQPQPLAPPVRSGSWHPMTHLYHCLSLNKGLCPPGLDKSSCRGFWEQELKLRLFAARACRCLFFLHPFLCPHFILCCYLGGSLLITSCPAVSLGVGSFLLTCPIYLIHLRAESRREGGCRAP